MQVVFKFNNNAPKIICKPTATAVIFYFVLCDTKILFTALPRALYLNFVKLQNVIYAVNKHSSVKYEKITSLRREPLFTHSFTSRAILYIVQQSK